jgi:hypothetical protein
MSFLYKADSIRYTREKIKKDQPGLGMKEGN